MFATRKLCEVTSRVLYHLQPQQRIIVSNDFTDPVTGRVYLRLATGDGWVPVCSRRDARQLIVDYLGKAAQ